MKIRRAGKGEPMIFLHNGGTSHRIWANQLRHFSRKYHIYAMDNLRFGQSDKPDIDYPLELHINQLKAFIEHLGIDKVILVGHCMVRPRPRGQVAGKAMPARAHHREIIFFLKFM